MAFMRPGGVPGESTRQRVGRPPDQCIRAHRHPDAFRALRLLRDCRRCGVCRAVFLGSSSGTVGDGLASAEAASPGPNVKSQEVYGRTSSRNWPPGAHVGASSALALSHPGSHRRGNTTPPARRRRRWNRHAAARPVAPAGATRGHPPREVCDVRLRRARPPHERGGRRLGDADYRYDPLGNRAQKTHGTALTGYVYGASQRLTATTGVEVGQLRLRRERQPDVRTPSARTPTAGRTCWRPRR